MEINIKTAIDELHRAFHLFNEAKFENRLPEPAILIQQRGNKRNVNGWCSTNKIWLNSVTEETRYEINIVAESLNRTLYQIMGTLIHEMVHLHNLVNDIKDVSRNGTYHNKQFKIIAESVGLIVDHDKRLGWSLTSLQDSTIDLINSFNIREESFGMFRYEPHSGDEETGTGKSRSTSRKYYCPGCNTIIKATKEVNIICGVCKVTFKEEETS